MSEQRIANIVAIVDLILRMTPHATGLIKHFTERVSAIPPEQLDQYFADTSAGFDAIIAKGKAEAGDAPPPAPTP